MASASAASFLETVRLSPSKEILVVGVTFESASPADEGGEKDKEKEREAFNRIAAFYIEKEWVTESNVFLSVSTALASRR